MKIETLVELFRKQVADQSLPYLWDDVEVFQYLVDAQDMLVRIMGGIADASTTAVVSVPVAIDQPFSEHCPYILRIRSAKLLTAKRKIAIANEADLAQLGVLRNSVLSDYGSMVPQYLDDTDTGEVVAGILGVTENQIRWYKVPVAEDTCILNTLRLPYPRMEDMDDCLEVDEQHHIHLLKWMKHMAYSKEDAETYNNKLAADNETLFRRYCDDARAEKERQRYKPRIVHYGGIAW